MMNLFKTSFFGSIGSFAVIISGILLDKILSIFAGPTGLALMGQFQNASTIFRTVANGAVNDGIIKYSSEFKEDDEKRDSFFSSTFIFMLICSLLVSVTLLAGNKFWSNLILKSSEYNFVFIVFSVTIFLFSFHTFLMSILIGFKEIKKYTSVNILGSILNTVLGFCLIYYFKTYGVLILLVINQFLLFFVSLYIIRSNKILSLKSFTQGFQREHTKTLFHYMVMSLSALAIMPITLILVRELVIHFYSWNDAGLWQAMWRIFTAFSVFFTTVLRLYFLPRFSELSCNKQIKYELRKGIKVVVPSTILALLVMFFLRDFIIHLLFTSDFIEMRELFLFTLLGGVFHIIAEVYSYLFIAKTYVIGYVLKYMIFSISFIVLSYLLMNNLGLVGVSVAFCFAKFIQMLFMIFVLNKKHAESSIINSNGNGVKVA